MNLLSRSTRVTIMLVFSATLFLLEQIVGYAAGSIALVADSFHMLNDMLSLAVALYAIKIAAYRESVPRNTYGWQRAEILGALFNGVLLLGLCLTIYTEAIQRFIDPVPVSNPKLVLVTGCTGMLFNVIGLWLFGDLHGHGHGHDHDHGRHHHRHGSEELQRQASSPAVGHLAHGIPTEAQPLLPQSSSSSSSPADGYHHHHAVHLTPSSASASTSSSTTDLEASRSYYPPYAQQSIVNAAQIQRSMLDREDAHDHEHEHDTGSGRRGNKGHLNMHGVWLHVFGDCLANLAVIASAAFIWLTDYSWRFYIDPVVSIIINTIVVAA
ncbi:Zinc resistance conferring protein, partial [Spiromyces aspiralis]